MIDPIVTAVILSARERRLAKGENPRNVLAALLEKREIEELVDEASALRAIAASVEQESTPAAVKARAQARQQAETERIARGETSTHNGMPMLTKGGHLSRMEALAKASQIEASLPALRRRAAEAKIAADAALRELSARGGTISPVEREHLQDVVEQKGAGAREASDDVRSCEEQIAKLRT